MAEELRLVLAYQLLNEKGRMKEGWILPGQLYMLSYRTGKSMCSGYTHKSYRIKTALKKLFLSLAASLCVYDNNYIYMS
jgi:hypothetical protein